MTKSMITKIWAVGLLLLIVGLLVGGVGLGLMLAYGGHFTSATNGSTFTFVPKIDGFFWTTVGLMIGGFTTVAVGGILHLATLIGAIINTYQIPDKTWFIVLIAGGAVGLTFPPVGFAVLVAYVIAGPDAEIATKAIQVNA